MNDKIITRTIIKFGKPDKNGDILRRGCFQESNLKELKIRGVIKDYKMKKNGVILINEFDLKEVSICK